MCLNILSSSINLIYSDNSQIISNLDHSLQHISNEKQAENSSISLRYLSQSDNCKKLLNTDSEENMQALIRVFTQCC